MSVQDRIIKLDFSSSFQTYNDTKSSKVGKGQERSKIKFFRLSWVDDDEQNDISDAYADIGNFIIHTILDVIFFIK